MVAMESVPRVPEVSSCEELWGRIWDQVLWSPSVWLSVPSRKSSSHPLGFSKFLFSLNVLLWVLSFFNELRWLIHGTEVPKGQKGRRLTRRCMCFGVGTWKPGKQGRLPTTDHTYFPLVIPQTSVEIQQYQALCWLVRIKHWMGQMRFLSSWAFHSGWGDFQIDWGRPRTLIRIKGSLSPSSGSGKSQRWSLSFSCWGLQGLLGCCSMWQGVWLKRQELILEVKLAIYFSSIPFKAPPCPFSDCENLDELFFLSGFIFWSENGRQTPALGTNSGTIPCIHLYLFFMHWHWF